MRDSGLYGACWGLSFLPFFLAIERSSVGFTTAPQQSLKISLQTVVSLIVAGDGMQLTVDYFLVLAYEW